MHADKRKKSTIPLMRRFCKAVGRKKNNHSVERLSDHGDHTGSMHIKDVINTIFTTSTLPINFDDMKIWKLWDDVVGEAIAQHARPFSINKGVLVVKVTDSIWLQELEFKIEDIKQGLNSRLQRRAIKKIRLRVGAP
jgi:hypothetical protein